MRWRYLILGVLASWLGASAIHLWPPIPAFQITDSGARPYVGEDRDRQQLIFLFFDPKGDQAPAIERRSTFTGELIASQPLEWTAMKEWDHVSHYAEISDNCRTLLWSQQKSASLPNPEW